MQYNRIGNNNEIKAYCNSLAWTHRLGLKLRVSLLPALLCKARAEQQANIGRKIPDVEVNLHIPAVETDHTPETGLHKHARN